MNLGAHAVTLRQLQYAVAVAQELSFRAAAARCHVSQPSLSAQIAELERVLGVALFERNRRRVLVTPAGRDLVDRAHVVLLAFDDLLGAARYHVDPLTGTLRLGVIPTVAPYLVPELDPALRAAFPELTVRWIEDKTDVLVERLHAAQLDGALLAVVSGLGGLEVAPIMEDPFVLAAPPDHPLSEAAGPLRVGELRRHEVLLLDDGHCFRDQALDLCASAGAHELGFRATSLATLVQMVASGAGLTLLPSIAVAVDNRHGRLRTRAFAPPAPARTLALAWRSSSPLDEALRALAAVSREALVAR